jgi:hypothetical protein
MLKDNILRLFQMLEEALFTTMSSYDSIEQEEPGNGMELRIRKNGHGWNFAL